MHIFIRIIPVILLLVAVFVQCKPKTIPEANKPLTEINTNNTDNNPELEDAPVLLPPDIEPELVASIRRTPCFGNCPVYEIKLFRDGTVLYTGRKNVPRIGPFKAKADRTFIEQIMRKAFEVKYFNLQDRYPASGTISDLPLTIIYFRQGNQFKLINDYFDSPPELQSFEKFLDDMFEKLTYMPIE